MKPQGWLLPLSIPYQAIIQIRNRMYDNGIFESFTVDAPVISVGNIAAGGTGKTPFVIHLLERLSNNGYSRKFKTVVLSRGYKGSYSGTLLVCDGKRVLATPSLAGDEPVLIARSPQRSPVVVDRNRVRGAQFAVNSLKAKMIILDDGFQHRRLKRDLDIVLLDAMNPFGNSRVFPAGFLREPPKSLARADLIVLSKAEVSADQMAERCANLSKVLEKPVIATQLKDRYWKKISGDQIFAPEEIAGKKVFAFAGIARPESFFRSIVRHGGEIVAELALPDHCNYSTQRIDSISRAFARSKAEWIVTTAKDALKLPEVFNLLPAFYLDTGFETIVGAEVLDEMLVSAFRKGRILKDGAESE